MKVYVIIFNWDTEDADGTIVEAFDTYEKAVKCFNRFIENEKNRPGNWVSKAFDKNGNPEDYYVDYNNPCADGEEHELWWSVECKRDLYLYDHLELNILEVQ